MKKLTTIFTLVLFALFTFSSCEREQWGDNSKTSEEDNRAEGQIGLSSLNVSVDESVSSTVTRSGINTDNYIIRIYDVDKEGKMVQEWKYSDMPEIFTLKVSHYTITAMSHEVQPAEFEKPYYFASQNFEITENTVTNLKELVCSMNNIKVRIDYDDDLKTLLGDDSKVGVSVGEGRLEYNKDETRAGYFKSIGETNILIANLSATIQGEKVAISKAFIDVQPGEERVVKYSLKQNSGGNEGGEEGGGDESGTIGGLKIRIDVTCEVVEKEIVVDPGEEELPNPDVPVDPDEPDEPEPEPVAKPTIIGDGFDITKSITIPPGTSMDNPYPVIVKIAAAEGIKNMEVGITSSSTDFTGAITDLNLANFDLANPGSLKDTLLNLGLPYGEAVFNKTDINFDVSGFTGLLTGFPGTHRFSLKVTDNNGNTASGILTLIVN